MSGSCRGLDDRGADAGRSAGTAAGSVRLRRREGLRSPVRGSMAVERSVVAAAPRWLAAVTAAGPMGLHRLDACGLAEVGQPEPATDKACFLLLQRRQSQFQLINAMPKQRDLRFQAHLSLSSALDPG